MGNELLASKIIITESEPTVRAAPTLATSICAAVGITERGPVNKATLVKSLDEYHRIFGGPVGFGGTTEVRYEDLYPSIVGFFANGGSMLYVVRVVAYIDGYADAAAASLMLGGDDGLEVIGKYPGTYANHFYIRISAPSNGKALCFNLAVVKNGIVLESFPNVSVEAANSRYVKTVVNSESNLVAIGKVNNTVIPPITPANQPAGPLAGGVDGLGTIGIDDFIGNVADKTGLYALDTVHDARVVIIPGVSARSEVANAMINYCEIERGKSMFAVLDPPKGLSAQEVAAYVTTEAALYNVSEFGAFYWPRITMRNTSKTVYGSDDHIVVPPSGHVAGIYSRTDAMKPGGVYEAPAGVEVGRLAECSGLETDEVLDEKARDYIYPLRINPITKIGTSPIHIDGSRTLKENGNFPSIPQRRGVIHISQTVKEMLLPFKHRPVTQQHRDRVQNSIDLLLNEQTRLGAFASEIPSEAYYIDMGENINPASALAKGILKAKIGLATAVPNEFIILEIGQDTRAIEEQLASAG